MLAPASSGAHKHPHVHTARAQPGGTSESEEVRLQLAPETLPNLPSPLRSSQVLWRNVNSSDGNVHGSVGLRPTTEARRPHAYQTQWEGGPTL